MHSCSLRHFLDNLRNITKNENGHLKRKSKLQLISTAGRLWRARDGGSWRAARDMGPRLLRAEAVRDQGLLRLRQSVRC